MGAGGGMMTAKAGEGGGVGWGQKGEGGGVSTDVTATCRCSGSEGHATRQMAMGDGLCEQSEKRPALTPNKNISQTNCIHVLCSLHALRLIDWLMRNDKKIERLILSENSPFYPKSVCP